jgi:hypothetical protein
MMTKEQRLLELVKAQRKLVSMTTNENELKKEKVELLQLELEYSEYCQGAC